jgi:hypothetical protein
VVLVPGEEERMAIDYDAPRRVEVDEMVEDAVPELSVRRAHGHSGPLDVDEPDPAETFELPGADLSGEQLTMRVLPKRADEFTCSSCFLVVHRSRLATHRGGQPICRECA